MKKILFSSLVFIGIITTSHINAQILDKLKNKVKQKADQRADNKTDKAIDKTLDTVDPTTGKSTNSNENKNPSSPNAKSDEQSAGSYPSLKSYSKYDFVPGNKIIYADDFSQEVIGEFPVNWNTNGMGEIVTLENLPGKWLQLKNEMKYVTGSNAKLPENCTIEFDLLAEFIPEKGIPPYISFIVLGNKSSGGNAELGDNLPGFNLNFRLNIDRNPDGDDIIVYSRDAERARYFDGEYAKNSAFTEMNRKKKPVHVALWIQKQRLRVWLNDKKVYDAPKAIPTGVSLNRMRIDVFGQSNVPGSQYHISNFNVAEATPDLRSKLLTEGKWSTNGILFDVNSDQIKPTSYGVLKEIAATLNENPTVKVKIIGHTDTDGDASKNLDLSRRRSASVKSALASDFNIDPSRLETDGMGGTKPVADNKTPEGKAQNRRVEFIKL